jgi:hypothetical protein
VQQQTLHLLLAAEALVQLTQDVEIMGDPLEVVKEDQLVNSGKLQIILAQAAGEAVVLSLFSSMVWVSIGVVLEEVVEVAVQVLVTLQQLAILETLVIMQALQLIIVLLYHQVVHTQLLSEALEDKLIFHGTHNEDFRF